MIVKIVKETHLFILELHPYDIGNTESSIHEHNSCFGVLFMPFSSMLQFSHQDFAYLIYLLLPVL